ncbi:MAG: SDR family NAD(P)-dependent oxidoreductase [Elusimicrobia bacterium]|nr:SDR family NAD(P)-dependent oxidoreductase [Elusimicrobiota bacterium]
MARIAFVTTVSQSWRGERVLVTGAGGFIGSHLTETLAARGAKVRALVRYNGRNDWGHLEALDPALKKNVEVVSGDVRDPRQTAEAVSGCSTVFHLAALIAIPYSYHAPQSFVDVNVTGTLNILEACREARVKRLVHTSTSEVYGTARYAPIDEEHPLQGQSPYSASKIAADKIVESYHRSFGLPAVTVRPFNTYGPRQSARAVIPAVLCQLLSGKKTLAVGSLEPVRDFNYVADTVEGFLAAARAPKAVGEVLNIGAGRGVTIGRTVELLMKLSGRKAALRQDARRVRPAKSEVFKLLCDNRKAAKLAGWKPKFSLEEGLVRTIEHVRANLESYKSDLYNL